MLSSGIDFFLIFVISSYWASTFSSDLTRNVMVDRKSDISCLQSQCEIPNVEKSDNLRYKQKQKIDLQFPFN